MSMNSNHYKPSEEDEDEDDDEGEDEDYDGNSEFISDEDNQEEDEDTSTHHVILDGTLSFSTQGNLIYSGIWYMNHEVPQTDDDDGDNVDNHKGEKEDTPSTHTTQHHFEWISKDLFQHPLCSTSQKEQDNKINMDNLWIDLNDPLKIHSSSTSTVPAETSSSSSFKDTSLSNAPRNIVFLTGYFETSPSTTTIVDASFPSSTSNKMEETDLELTLSYPNNNNNNNNNHSELIFQVQGKGKNDYGAFTLQGEYIPRRKYCKQYSLICHKVYRDSTLKRKYLPGEEEEEEEEDDEEEELSIDDEENAYEELMDLYEDAKLSLQEVTQQYSNGERSSRRGHIMKRSRKNEEEEEEEEDIDQGCGF